MNKQKNTSGEARKDNVSVLERIRRRTGLLVGLVGLALVIFILESLLGSGASIFGNDEYTTVGHIEGKKIDRNEFLTRLEAQLNNYRQRNKGQEVDEQMRSQAIESVMQQYVVDNLMMPEFENAGIRVGDDELYENVVVNPAPSVVQNLTDPNTGRINEQFSRPDGTLDPAKWRQAVQNVTGESEMAVRQMEEMVKNAIYFQKFRAMVSKSLFVTTAEARNEHMLRATIADFKNVVKRYDEIPDSLVTVGDSDLEKYYKEHSFEFRSKDNSRRVEYVVFNVTPTPEDLAAIEKEANRVAEELKGKSPAEDSVILAQESENGAISIKNLGRKDMVIRDTAIYTAAPGTVFGPYNEGAYFKVYKLESVNMVADSARVRHILIGLNDPQSQQQKRTKERAKKEADSLLTLIKDKKVTFDTLVKTYSDDPGSKTNGGDYGWFDEQEGFVEPFKNAGLRGVKGNISVVETQFGYHIIEVLDVSKTKHTSYQVAEVFKPIAPSDETNQRVFAEASRFGGENNTAELFDSGVEKQKLIRRVAENVKEGEYRLPGLEGAKDMVKWAFTANKGEVSVFTMNDKHVVAKLAGIRTKGVLPMEEVKTELTKKVLDQKKGEMLLAEFEQKAGQSNNIDEIAKKLNTEVITQQNLTFNDNNISGLGMDLIVAGTVMGTSKGKVSKATASHNAVFRVAVTDLRQAQGLPSYNEIKREMHSSMTSRSDYEVFTALREAADIEFHRSRID
jgi:peptidyl-prolyl cis-trans isomerase D